MLYIRICVLLYVCSAVYETRTYGAMRGARGAIPYIYSMLYISVNSYASFLLGLSFGLHLTKQLFLVFGEVGGQFDVVGDDKVAVSAVGLLVAFSS